MKPWWILIATALALSVTAPTANAMTVHTDDDGRVRGIPRICAEEVNGARQWATDLARIDTEGVLVLDGREIALRGDAAQWRLRDEVSPDFASRFHSMSWVVLGLHSDIDVVGLLLQREAAAPDPGFAAGSAALQESGWTSGVVRLRMGTVSCVFEATRDERLIPVMDALVNANLDPYRYRGAPVNAVHNQGTLANVALLEAARIFERPEWREPAIRRFERDAGTVFKACGMTSEQSSTYHRLNVNLWRRSLEALGAEVEFDVDMGARVRRAALALVQVTRPDRILEAIGTGNRVTVDAADLGVDTANSSTRLFCPDLGWAANRSSWDDSATHYVLRFGPRPSIHGHEDRGAMTWYAQGVPVFSDRGIFDRTRNARREWAESAAAHSTFYGVGSTWKRPFRATYARYGAVDHYRISTSYRESRLTREFSIPLAIDDTESILEVSDTGTSQRARQWYQYWQLAEGWTPLERATAWEPAAVHERTGLFLYGSCRSGPYMRMAVRVVETFPAWRVAERAYSLDCGGQGRDVRIQTLWVVSPVAGKLAWNALTGEYAVLPPAPPGPDPVDPVEPTLGP